MGISPLTAAAQQVPQVLDRGEVLQLTAPDGFKSYQWQVSTDLKNFVNLPKGQVQNLNLKVYAPGFYRLKATTNDNKTSYIDTVAVELKEVTYNKNFTVSGGAHGYVETTDGVPGAKGINIPEDREGAVAGVTKALTNWTDGKSMAVYYLNHPKNIIDTDMLLKVKKNANVAFRITVWDPSDTTEPLAESYHAFRGTGETDTIRLVGLNIPHKDYYRYQLECLNGWSNIIEISKYLHHSPTSAKSYKPGYLSSPSVHLNQWRSTASGAPKGRAYDWCYQEVMMPQEADIPGTYIMSLGVLDGYMGIQMNGYKNGKPLHDVIFSMWDHGSVDENPNLPDNLRANVVDHGEGVEPNRFNNEGTGMKTFKSGYNWECGTFVQFITNCRPEKATYTIIENGKEKVITQNNTLVSAWYNAQDGKGWQYMATLRLANKSINFDSWYSFLENYNWPTGQALRRGFYRNGYGHAKNTNKWYHFNQVNFGHTDGGTQVGKRNDFGQGTCDEYDDAFFMTTGGFIPSKVTGSRVPLNKENTAVDTINLQALLDRVDLAVANEKKMIEEKENFKKNKLDKSNWKVIKFSSEETSGEGSNGRAAQTIDSDPKTYWHSKWTGGAAKCPHFLTVDMVDTRDITGFEITMSGGSRRYIQAFNLYMGENKYALEKVYSDNNVPDMETFHFMLDQPVKARYFKLEITDSRADDGDHVRINEIEVTASPIPTGIDALKSEGGQLKVVGGKNEVFVTSPIAFENAEISVFRTDGACLSTCNFATVAAGETVSVPMLSAVKGVYVLTIKSGDKSVSKQFMWNK